MKLIANVSNVYERGDTYKDQPKKIKVIIKQVKSRIAYSDKNRKAKLAPEYSVLNPETNSDSDSEKSKGARWSSARDVINQIPKKAR